MTYRERLADHPAESFQYSTGCESVTNLFCGLTDPPIGLVLRLYIPPRHAKSLGMSGEVVVSISMT